MTGALSYSLPASRGYMGDPRRGASMGRGNCHAADKTAPLRFYLRRVRLDADGYDGGGAYWGHGAPLYHAQADAESLCVGGFTGAERFADRPEMFFRARSRAEAVAEVSREYPNASFFREAHQ